jgi:hypothetical protein
MEYIGLYGPKRPRGTLQKSETLYVLEIKLFRLFLHMTLNNLKLFDIFVYLILDQRIVFFILWM